jgi:ligand-binding SRPBCC domain-containing protein
VVTITLETRINAPAGVCFDLSRNIDMHTASMKKSKEKAVAGVTSGLIEKGQFVTWRATHFFIPMYMTVKIVEMEFPHYFIDIMIKGPFKSLWHKHSFLQEDGYTMMKDEFIIEAPLGILGKIAERLFLKSYMKNLLVKRNQVLKNIAETSGGFVQ